MSNKQAYPRKYRTQAIKSVFAILFFIAVYLMVLILSFAFVAFLFYFSVLVLKSASAQNSIFFYFMTFVVIDVIAITLLAFILRFFFRKQTVDRSGWLEINNKTQPKLFALIESISKELDTNFPQKVYLGTGVDAMVFYDSNFRNLFVPSKENLMIGLGLVNSMTDCELKTIIAHEFGHFTQRSLNVFSYIYIENQIIYKMLMDEAFYHQLILSFTKMGKFSWIIIYYSRSIRWILRKAYHIVSRSYMALSREMEFHADEVSANIGGSVPGINALLRLSLAGDSFNYVWQFYYNKISDNYKTENVYPQHKFVMHKLASKHGLQFINDIPQVTKEILSGFNRSKLVIENQWASHPSIADRIKRLEDLNVKSEISHESAWNYFVSAEELQKEVTDKLFRNWEFSGPLVNLTLPEFEDKYMSEVKRILYDDRYSYFYEYRSISQFDIKSAIENEDKNIFENFDQIYIEENLDLIYHFTGLTNDIQTIDSIANGDFKIDLFEYDGKKYKSKESGKLCNQLKKIHEEMHKKIVDLDIKIFRYFYKVAKSLNREDEIVNCYNNYFYLVDQDKTNLKVYLDMIDAIQFIYRFYSFNTIEIKLKEMKIKEDVFVERIKIILSDKNYLSIISKNQREKLQNYVDKKIIYFENRAYNSESLKILQEVIFEFYEVCSRAPFYGLKRMLDFQMEILDSQQPI